MKRIKYIVISAVTATLISSVAAFSQPLQSNYDAPKKPYPISNIFTRSAQGIIGLNFISSQIAAYEVKKQTEKTIKGKISVSIKPYSAFDLLSGKFKSFKIKAKNIESNGIYVSNFEAASMYDFIYVDYKHNPVKFLAPVKMSFHTSITQDDLNKMLLTPLAQANLTKIKAKINNKNVNILDFNIPKMEISHGKINLSTKVHLAGLPSYFNIPIDLTAGLKIENDKIKLNNLQILQNNNINISLVSNIIETITPVIIDFSDIGIKGSKIKIKDLSINNDKIDISGIIWIPAN